ncbi:MAG TPA: Spy/CpxP family protein refolding chaperone [Polyangia bacterium]|jgi:Spy/CpxP family protein refolding chaperone|nr:Spy/CpxP family protein refolding chaperone [Polyangia bacterium]
MMQRISQRLRSHRRVLIALGAVVGLAAVTAGATAYAHGPGRHAFVKRMLSERLDAALDAAQATPAQRTAIHAASERAFGSMAALRHGPEHGADLERGLTMFTADRFDPAELTAGRQERLARMHGAADAFFGALRETHEALTAPQRHAFAAYFRSQAPAHLGAGHLMQNMMERHIDAALDAAQPTAEQKATLDAARAQLRSTLAQARPHQRIVQDVLSLLEEDRWDEARVQKLRAEQEAAWARIGDAMAQTLKQAHDVLTPAQRQAVVSSLRAQRDSFRQRFHGDDTSREGAPTAPQGQ